MEYTEFETEHKESSALGDSDKGPCSEAPQIGAAGSRPDKGAGETSLTEKEHLTPNSDTLENLECLAEKVGTLGLQTTRRNRCGAAEEWARRVKLAGAPIGGQPKTTSFGQPESSLQPSTFGFQHRRGHGAAGQMPPPPEDRGHPQGPSKRQRSMGSTPEGGQAKRPKGSGQLSYARVARKGF
jgi:hypothetical protein